MSTKKTVLITGASSGIGEATARHLAEKGYTVIGAARRVEKMQHLKEWGIDILPMDLSNDDSIRKTVDTIIQAEGKIDILINVAGFGLYGAVEDVSMDDARYQMEVNVIGLARLCQLVLPYMRRQRWGKIVNVTSIGGKMATPLGGWYHASKFAVEGLSDSLRLEVKQFGIDVILIEPGGVKTEWGAIAFDNATRVSGNTTYGLMTAKAKEVADKFDHGSEPIEIARLIGTAIEAENPRPRYVKGYMARPVLFAKKWLGDRLFDKLIMNQLK